MFTVRPIFARRQIINPHCLWLRRPHAAEADIAGAVARIEIIAGGTPRGAGSAEVPTSPALHAAIGRFGGAVWIAAPQIGAAALVGWHAKPVPTPLKHI